MIWTFSNKSMVQEGGIFLQPFLPKELLIKNISEDIFLLNQDSWDVNPYWVLLSCLFLLKKSLEWLMNPARRLSHILPCAIMYISYVVNLYLSSSTWKRASVKEAFQFNSPAIWVPILYQPWDHLVGMVRALHLSSHLIYLPKLKPKETCKFGLQGRKSRKLASTQISPDGWLIWKHSPT